MILSQPRGQHWIAYVCMRMRMHEFGSGGERKRESSFVINRLNMAISWNGSSNRYGNFIFSFLFFPLLSCLPFSLSCFPFIHSLYSFHPFLIPTHSFTPSPSISMLCTASSCKCSLLLIQREAMHYIQKDSANCAHGREQMMCATHFESTAATPVSVTNI